MDLETSAVDSLYPAVCLYGSESVAVVHPYDLPAVDGTILSEIAPQAFSRLTLELSIFRVLAEVVIQAETAVDVKTEECVMVEFSIVVGTVFVELTDTEVVHAESDE